MRKTKTINGLQLKKTSIATISIIGGLPIQNNITRRYCDPGTQDSICHCSRSR
jgi:hypothetical protein